MLGINNHYHFFPRRARDLSHHSLPMCYASVASLNESQLGGGDVESIDVRGQTGVGLLGTIGADKGVDLDSVDVVELLQGLLDLGLVGLDVDNEDKAVVLLNLAHGALGVERVHDDLVLVQAGLVGNGLARVLAGAGELQGLGQVEGGRQADLVGLLGVNTLQRSLRGSVGLLGALGRLGRLTGAYSIAKDTSAHALFQELAKSAVAGMHCDRRPSPASAWRGSRRVSVVVPSKTSRP